MLYWLTALSDGGDVFNLFRYITFRAGGAFLTALVFGFAFGPRLIGWLRIKQGKGQPIRSDGPQTHFVKAGTPTMGGLLIISALLFSTLLWARWDNHFVWMVMFVTVSFALLGFADDYAKVKKQTVDGVSGRVRLTIGFLVAAIAGIWAAGVHPEELSWGLALPFVNDVMLNLGFLFIPFAMIVIVGAANAVNLTDGLDGLAIMPVMIAAGTFGAIAYAVGRTDFTEYLGVHFVPGSGELIVFVGALVGACLAFLWYNAPPAAVFMGDTGSLALGGAIGTIAVITNHELVLVIVGGLFVLEAVSVIVQVASFKMTGKRVFRMAPIHHHFEQLGWPESTVVIRFWIISIVLAIVGGLFVVEALSVIIQVLVYKRTGKRVFLMAPIHHHFEKKGWAEPQIVIRFWIVSLILAMIGLATLKVR